MKAVILAGGFGTRLSEETDKLYMEAVKLVISEKKASTSFFMKVFFCHSYVQ